MVSGDKRYFEFQHTAARRRLASVCLAVTNCQKFQHTAARRRLEMITDAYGNRVQFQHTAARRRLANWAFTEQRKKSFQHTAARRRLDRFQNYLFHGVYVSTHSRPKAAGPCAFQTTNNDLMFQHTAARRRLECPQRQLRKFPLRFNTQPPEGGWIRQTPQTCLMFGFNTQPPEGGWPFLPTYHKRVSCFNTQPPEGGWRCARRGGNLYGRFNTQPPEGGWTNSPPISSNAELFQHTAARRRLVGFLFQIRIADRVSTHSRPKAAGQRGGVVGSP